jgi:hypothetical protein
VVKLQKYEKQIKRKEENLDYTYLLSSSSSLHLQPETLEKLLVKVKMLV